MRSPHAHARVGRIETADARATAGVIAVLTGDRRRRRRSRAAHAQSDAGQSPRGDHPPPARRLPGAASPDAGRPRAVRGRGGRHGHRRHAGRRARRRRARQRGMDTAAGGNRQPDRRRSGAPLLYDGAPSNVCVDVEAGDPARRGGRLRACRPRGAARDVGPAGHRGDDGAAGGDRGVGSGQWPLHRPRRRRRPGAHAHRRGRRARRARERGARGRARRGRQLRHAQQLLSGVRAGRLGGPAPRPAREVDGRPARGIPGRLPGPRSRLARRAGPRRRRHLPGVSRRQHQQRRRPRRLVSSAQQGHGDRDHGLRHSGGVGAWSGRRHQHVADHALSQRRPPRGHVRHGAADRSRRSPSRLRSPRAAAAQPGAGRRDAVPERSRHPVRQRRLPGGAGPRRRPRGLGGIRGAPGRGAPARTLPWNRGRQLPRDQHGRSPRARPHHRASRGAGRPRPRHALVRAGPRDEFRPAPGRVARRGARRGAADHRRHRRHRDGRRRPFRAGAPAGGDRDGQGLGSDRGEGHADRRRDAGGGRGRHRVLRPALPREGHRPFGRSLRGGGRRPPRRALRRGPDRAVLPVRLRRVRGRGGPRDRRGRGGALHHGRRLWPRREPDDPARPDPRRHRPGRGAGAVGIVRLRWPRPASSCRRA